MIDVNELRKGVTFEYDGQLLKVIEYSHHKPGRGNATIKIKARNLRTGSNIEKTFQSGDRVPDARLDYHNVSYLYTDGDFYHFMDGVTFDQPAIKADILGDSAGGVIVQVPNFVKEGDTIRVDTRTGEYLTRV